MADIKAKPIAGETWVHLKSEKEYDILSTGQLKVEGGEWTEAVVYWDATSGGYAETYVRDMPTFVDKFRKAPKG